MNNTNIIRLTIPSDKKMIPHNFKIETYEKDNLDYMRMAFNLDEHLKVIIPKIALNKIKINKEKPFHHMISSFNNQEEMEITFSIEPIYIKENPVFMNFIQQPKKMTIKEIEQELGYPISIIKE